MRNGNGLWYKLICLALALALAVPMLAACGGKKVTPTPTPTRSELKLGDAVDLTTASIDQGGGTITVDRPGDPLDGLELEVPKGSYEGRREFTISYRPITGHSYDDRINPISPLISVENGGGYANEVMALKVPVEVPEGHFAMGFFYDEESGALEGMPLLAVDDGSITVGTRHFSDFFISSISEPLLLNINVDSGFRPGVDDWQFVNRGSYIEQEGHCAGQSIAAMWYYYERKLGGEPDLYGRYDNNGESPNTPDLWEDDSLGYRLASAVQHDLNWDSLERAALRALSTIDGRLTFLAFAYAMSATGGPQYMGVRSNAGGGHAIVAYAISGGAIYVADPNKPGVRSEGRAVQYRDGELSPYSSAQRVGAPGKQYEWIMYMAVGALVDWDQVGARWAELDGGAVGDDVFPSYEVTGLVGKERGQGTSVPVSPGVLNAYEKWLTLELQSAKNLGWRVYRDGSWLRTTDRSPYYIELQPGLNRLGILVQGSGAEGWEYVDFRWLDVYYTPPLSPTPSATPQASPTPTAVTAAGDWVLQEIIIESKKDEESDYYFNHTVSIGDGFFASSGSWKTYGPYYSGSGSSTGSWTAPPSYLKAGSTLTLTLECQAMGQETGGLMGTDSMGWIYLTLNPPADNLGGRMTWSQKIGHDAKAVYSAGGPPGSDSMTDSIEIPQGKKGDVLVIFFSVGGRGGSGKVIYKYVYGGTGPVPPRSTPPPITPAPLTPTPIPTPTATATPEVTPTATPPRNWTGVWDSNFGEMKLTQSDGSVTGTYTHDQGKIQGTVQGDKLIGTWSEAPSYAPPNDAGDIEFTLSPDGNAFSGRWRYGSSGDWSEWTATRRP